MMISRDSSEEWAGSSKIRAQGVLEDRDRLDESNPVLAHSTEVFFRAIRIAGASYPFPGYAKPEREVQPPCRKPKSNNPAARRSLGIGPAKRACVRDPPWRVSPYHCR